MKTLWLEINEKYDGSQLAPLRNYLKHGLLGTSCVAWVGACDVSLRNMKDGEDLAAGEKICGDKMLHFVFEVFDQSLFAGVALQRLMADLVRSSLVEMRPELAGALTRSGDDLYWGPEKRKLSISIATPTVNSVMIHFAINVVRDGTPVPTAGLADWSLDPKDFAHRVLAKVSSEYASIQEATWKVIPAR